MIKRICSVCGKEFSGGSAAAKYCSEACRNTPVFTDEFNGEVRGQLKVINAYRKNRRMRKQGTKLFKTGRFGRES